jgi:hypothetical protein
VNTEQSVHRVSGLLFGKMSGQYWTLCGSVQSFKALKTGTYPGLVQRTHGDSEAVCPQFPPL